MQAYPRLAAKALLTPHRRCRPRRQIVIPVLYLDSGQQKWLCGLLTYRFHFSRHPREVVIVRHLQQQVFGAGIAIDVADSVLYALYDLLACRFIVPIGAAWPLRMLSFLKLTFLEGISWKITRRLFHVDARSSCEKKVIRLARQTPLSCAEIIKSIEMDIRRLKDGYDVLDKLYDGNDLNCDNFAQAVREYRCSCEVITAVANLYLRQQIMLDTY